MSGIDPLLGKDPLMGTNSKSDARLVHKGAHTKRGWFVVLGVALLVLAVLAFCNLIAVTEASVLFMGALMTMGGIIQIVQAFLPKIRRGFSGWALGGILYVACGLIALYKPFVAAAVLTLVLALSLVASGIAGAWSGIRLRSQSGLRWMMASGMITALCGIIFAIGWPANSLYFLGTILAVDMTIQGAASIKFGVTREHSVS